jgi:hypothetical protein
VLVANYLKDTDKNLDKNLEKQIYGTILAVY